MPSQARFAGYTGFDIPVPLTRQIVIADSVFANNLNDYSFWIRAEFDGGRTHEAFSDLISYKVVCGSEKLSIATFSDNGVTVNRYISEYTHNGGTFNDTKDASVLTFKIP